MHSVAVILSYIDHSLSGLRHQSAFYDAVISAELEQLLIILPKPGVLSGLGPPTHALLKDFGPPSTALR